MSPHSSSCNRARFWYGTSFYPIRNQLCCHPFTIFRVNVSLIKSRSYRTDSNSRNSNMEIPPGLARKRRSTAALREELEPNKKKTQEAVAGETKERYGETRKKHNPSPKTNYCQIPQWKEAHLVKEAILSLGSYSINFSLVALCFR